VLHVTGSYWAVGLVFVQNARRGVVLEGASHNQFGSVVVQNVGEEGWLFARGSSANYLTSCITQNTGQLVPEKGHAVVVGQDDADPCTANVFHIHNTPSHITTSHYLIRNASSATELQRCTMVAICMKGGDTFAEVHSDRNIFNHVVVSNPAHSKVIVDAFRVWGTSNTFEHGVLDAFCAGYGFNVFATPNTICKSNTVVGAKMGISNIEVVKC
jgi:hypothetical protein